MKSNNRNDGHSVAPVWGLMQLVLVPRAWLLKGNSESLCHSPRKPSRAAEQHHGFLTTLEKNKLCLTWGRFDTRRPCSRCLWAADAFIPLTSTKNDITSSLIIQTLNDDLGNMILNFIRSCKRTADNWNVYKRMVSDGLTVENSLGICKKKFNTEDWNLSNVAVTFQ